MRYSMLILSALSFWVGCSDSKDDSCGTTLVYRDGSCTASASGGSGGSPTTTGGASATGGSDQTAPDGFGVVCEINTDCTGKTNYCAHSPVDPAPYCTASGCDADASVCPTGWTCFNVGQFAPGEPYVCMKP
jgi:hypothetical protein